MRRVVSICFRSQFASSVNKRMQQQLQSVSEKMKQKQTVADKKNLQQFLKQQTKDGRIITSIDRTAKYDE